MSNQASFCVPAAATGNMGVPSVSAGYSATDTFLDDDAIRHRTCLGCAFGKRFSSSCRFRVIDLKISQIYL